MLRNLPILKHEMCQSDFLLYIQKVKAILALQGTQSPGACHHFIQILAK